MSLRSYQWYDYHFRKRDILDEWLHQLVCLEGWKRETAQKYIDLILSGSPPVIVARKFKEFLDGNGFDEEDVDDIKR